MFPVHLLEDTQEMQSLGKQSHTPESSGKTNFCAGCPRILLGYPGGAFPCPIWLDGRGTGQWKWMEEVPRRTSLVPLAFPCFLHWLIGVETKNVLDYQGRAGDHFHCTVEPSPGHIRCRALRKKVCVEVLAPYSKEKASLDSVGPAVVKGRASCKSRHATVTWQRSTPLSGPPWFPTISCSQTPSALKCARLLSVTKIITRTIWRNSFLQKREISGKSHQPLTSILSKSIVDTPPISITILLRCYVCHLLGRKYHSYIYKAICCRVKTWSKIFWFFRVKTWSKVASKLGPRCFACFLILKCFLVILKTQMVCRGAKIFFGSLSGCQKRVFEK